MSAGKKSEIIFHVELDNDNIPERITWEATDSAASTPSECKSIMLSIWDHQQKDTLRIDLWTKDMPVDEMSAHFFQTLITLAETYQRATSNNFVAGEMRNFCKSLAEKIDHERQNKNAQK